MLQCIPSDQAHELHGHDTMTPRCTAMFQPPTDIGRARTLLRQSGAVLECYAGVSSKYNKRRTAVGFRFTSTQFYSKPADSSNHESAQVAAKSDALARLGPPDHWRGRRGACLAHVAEAESRSVRVGRAWKAMRS